MKITTVPAPRNAEGHFVTPPREPATRWITLKVPVYTTGHFSISQDGDTLTTAEFDDNQWTFIEKTALQHAQDMLQDQIEQLITPEVEFNPGPELGFPEYEDGDTEEQNNTNADIRLEAMGTVIDILENLLSEIEEEIGKRDI